MARLRHTPAFVPPLPAGIDRPGPARRNLWRVQSADLHRYGVLTIPTRAIFDRLSHRENVPGALGVREVKFVIADVNTPDPILYLMDMTATKLHYDFVQYGLGRVMSIAEFNRQTYFAEDRTYLAGSIIAHDGYGDDGLYTLEFWPSDIVRFPRVRLAFETVSAALPFARGRIAYHPTGDGQRDLMLQEAAQFDSHDIRRVQTTDLFAGISYSPLNLGVTYGRLGIFDGQSGRPPGATDIAIFRRLPNDLARVAGVISLGPQTPLSHVNLRAQQNNLPNAYLRDATTDPRILSLLDRIVRFEVTPDDIIITPATRAQMESHFATLRPVTTQTPARDLSVTTISPLSDIGFADHIAFGAKAANVAELRKLLLPHRVPDGFAVPYAFYHRFMTHTGLYDVLRAMIDAPDFAEDTTRREALKKLRKRIRDAPLPADLHDALTTLQNSFPADVTPRCRSSANAEDLSDFSGAGLYDSYTHHADEGHIGKSIKQVWASLWTFRAFEERAFHRIDHFACAMGVLVHPNFEAEQVNGVAVTQNIYFPTFPGFYVNAQIGEDRVTNPQGDAVAEEFLVMQNAGLETLQEFVTLRIRESNLVPAGGAVLSVAQTNLLIEQMTAIQSHFKVLYRRQLSRDFAMEIEFKIDRHGVLVIKQARPWTLSPTVN